MRYQVINNFHPYPKDAKFQKIHRQGEVLEGEELNAVLSHVKVAELLESGLIVEIKGSSMPLPVVPSEPAKEIPNPERKKKGE